MPIRQGFLIGKMKNAPKTGAGIADGGVAHVPSAADASQTTPVTALPKNTPE